MAIYGGAHLANEKKTDESTTWKPATTRGELRYLSKNRRHFKESLSNESGKKIKTTKFLNGEQHNTQK